LEGMYINIDTPVWGRLALIRLYCIYLIII